MTRGARPLSVTVIGGLLIAVGVIGFAYHLYEPLSRHSFQVEDFWIELTEVLALVFGLFLLRGRNWARWGVLAWMAFHVVLSAVDRMHGLAVHILFLIGFAYLLFRADAAAYFRSAASSEGNG